MEGDGVEVCRLQGGECGGTEEVVLLALAVEVVEDFFGAFVGFVAVVVDEALHGVRVANGTAASLNRSFMLTPRSINKNDEFYMFLHR